VNHVDPLLAPLLDDLGSTESYAARTPDVVALRAGYAGVRDALVRARIKVSDESEFERNHALVYELAQPGELDARAMLLLSPVGRRAALLAVPARDGRGFWTGPAEIVGSDGPFGREVEAALGEEYVELLGEALLRTEVAHRWIDPFTGAEVGRIPLFIALFGDGFEVRLIGEWFAGRRALLSGSGGGVGPA
jgi:hypothetical protein